MDYNEMATIINTCVGRINKPCRYRISMVEEKNYNQPKFHVVSEKPKNRRAAEICGFKQKTNYKVIK
jgi:hypothetical protein